MKLVTESYTLASKVTQNYQKLPKVDAPTHFSKESLRHEVIDLQTLTDEKALIGKLHRQIVALQSKEFECAEKIATLETKLARCPDLQFPFLGSGCGTAVEHTPAEQTS